MLPLAFYLPVNVAAQSEEPGANSVVLEEVIVTARKRDESVRDIPTSIDAFTGDRLDELGYSSIEDVLKLSPGVTFESGFTPSSFSVIVRGITNDSRGVGPRTVGSFYGNVPMTNPSIMGVEPDLDTFDMRSVEILKGPQGTLFGGSALAGAIRYEPNAPDFTGFNGAISLGTGSMASSDDNIANYALMLNAPLSENFALRFAGSVRELPGYIDDEVSGEKDINDYKATQARLIADWKLTDSLSLQGQYMKYEGELGAFSYIDGTEPVRVRTRRLLDDHEYSDVELYGAQLTWDAEDFSVVFEGNRLKKDRDQLNDVTQFLGLFGTGITVGQSFFEATDQDTFETRIVSNEPTSGDGLFGGWQYTAGLFYSESAQTRPVIIRLDFPTHIQKQGGGATIEAEEKAVYFDLTRTLGSNFELNLGGRYFDQTTTGGNFVDFLYTSLDPGGLPANIDFVPNFNSFATLTESGFNPKAALRWFATENATVIASYTQGFRFGGINGFSLEPEIPVPFSFGSDEIDNYELGLRTTWLEQRLTADITAFYVDWKNLQILQRASVYAYVDNVGAAEVKGVEAALNAALTEHLSVSFNASYQNAETSVFFESGEFGPIAAGTQLPQSPEWTGAAQLRYQGELGNLDLDSSLTYSYRGDSTNNLTNTVPLDGYGTLDLALSLQAQSMSMQPRVSLIGKNLTDESAALFGFTLAGVTDVISLNQPRQVMLKLDLSF
ncbi:hypothetical protein BA177_05105 [Woeseia oceani]|uniref:TonB-dependent receptor n=1 Tax=Woeseia oceani TaxID=1548547 RepID=A0A193LDZ7_9GAMM|nr:hypothetical protein BA177_05105 [Woeseia oceani]